jgi:hypothetical protein
MQSTRNSTLAAALVVGLGLVAGIDIGEEDRRYNIKPTKQTGPWGTKAQRRQDTGRVKRRACNKIARKSRAKNRGR